MVSLARQQGQVTSTGGTGFFAMPVFYFKKTTVAQDKQEYRNKVMGCSPSVHEDFCGALVRGVERVRKREGDTKQTHDTLSRGEFLSLGEARSGAQLRPRRGLGFGAGNSLRR